MKKDKLYYETLQWSHIKDIIHNRDKVCKRCSSTKDLNVHHLTYENFKNEFEHLDDLVLLCQKCHSILHNIFGYKNMNYPKQLYFIRNYKKNQEFKKCTEITSISSTDIRDILFN